MSGNKSLHAANRAKNDEFYTELADIDKELRHYKHHSKTKPSIAIATTRASAISFIIFPTISKPSA